MATVMVWHLELSRGGHVSMSSVLGEDFFRGQFTERVILRGAVFPAEVFLGAVHDFESYTAYTEPQKLSRY